MTEEGIGLTQQEIEDAIRIAKKHKRARALGLGDPEGEPPESEGFGMNSPQQVAEEMKRIFIVLLKKNPLSAPIRERIMRAIEAYDRIIGGTTPSEYEDKGVRYGLGSGKGG